MIIKKNMQKLVVVGIIILMAIIMVLDTKGIAHRKVENSNDIQVDSNMFSEVIPKEKKVINGNKEYSLEACFNYSDELQSQIKNSTDIISGQVEEVEFFETETATAWTKITVTTDKTYKGKLEKKEKIYIYVLGGYVNGSTYEKNYGVNLTDTNSTDTVVQLNYFQDEFPQKGDKAIYAMKKTNDEETYGEDSYFLTCSAFSQFKFEKKSQKYKFRRYEEKSSDISLDTIEKKICLFMNEDGR